MRVLLVALFAVTSLFACNTTISVKNYKTECTVAADCVGVIEGAVCERNCCINGAVSAADATRFGNDRSTMVKACLTFGAQPAVCDRDCASVVPACNAGVCGIKPEPSQGSTGYDRSCNSDDECAAVFVGTLCGDSCECPNLAINKSALPKFQADHDALVKTCPSERQACSHECGIAAAMPKCSAAHQCV